MDLEEDSERDRRTHVRAPFLVLEIKGKHSNKVFLAQTENIGQGGLCLKSRQPLKVGDRFPIEFVLPDNETTVSCTSEVVWKKRYDKSGIASEGIGIRFVDLGSDQKKVLGDWVDKEEKKGQPQ